MAAIAGADDALIHHHTLCFFAADFKALFVGVFFRANDIAEHLLQGRQLRFALLGFGQFGHKQGRGSRAACIPAGQYGAAELRQAQGIGGGGQFFGLGIEAVPLYRGIGTKSGIVWHVGKQIFAIPFVIGQQAGFECDGLLPCIAIKFKTAALKAAHEILVGEGEHGGGEIHRVWVLGRFAQTQALVDGLLVFRPLAQEFCHHVGAIGNQLAFWLFGFGHGQRRDFFIAVGVGVDFGFQLQLFGRLGF